jgi:hypothetical protein
VRSTAPELVVSISEYGAVGERWTGTWSMKMGEAVRSTAAELVMPMA